MTAPTFVDENELVFNTTTSPKTTDSISVNTGEVLVDCLGDENFETGDNYTVTNSGTAQTWTEVTPTLTSGADGHIQIATAVMSATQSMTVTGTRTSGAPAHWWGHSVLRYSGSNGVGNSATSATAQSVSITTSQADSSIVIAIVDFSAGSWGGTRPYLSVGGVGATEMTYFENASHYTIGIARWEGVGAAGAKTVGLTGLSGTFACVAIEILGTAGGTDGSVTAVKATATAAGQVPVVSAGSTVTGTLATATALASAPTVSGGGAGDVVATVATATAQGQPPFVQGDTNLTGSGPAAATALALPPTVTGSVPGQVNAIRAQATASAPAHVVSADSVITGVRAQATASAPAPIVSGAGLNGSVVAVTATATATARVPVVVATFSATVAAFTATASALAIAPDVEAIAPTYFFAPPTFEAPIQTLIRPFNYFRLTYAASIVRVNGILTEVLAPNTDLLTAAGEDGIDYFLGGREYEVTEAVANELIAAGYTVTPL